MRFKKNLFNLLFSARGKKYAPSEKKSMFCRTKKASKIAHFFCIASVQKLFFIYLVFAGNPNHIRLVLPIDHFGKYAIGNKQ